MPVKRKITEPEGIYFITFTCFQWLALIEQTHSYDLIYKWFDHLKSKGHYIAGYVIMPNHVHALIAFRNNGQTINTIVGNGKRFFAYEIIKRLEQQQESKLLHQLYLSVEAKGRERNKKHEVWEDSFVPIDIGRKECRTHKFMKQKLDYMHDNPVRGKCPSDRVIRAENLVATVAEYAHSSAKFYICGEHAAYTVMNFLELDDIDLTRSVMD